jgi:hypothetical protein
MTGGRPFPLRRDNCRVDTSRQWGRRCRASCIYAVEHAAVTYWVRCCAATAVPLMRSIVGVSGFNPRQIAEFAAGVKTLTRAFEESLTPA